MTLDEMLLNKTSSVSSRYDAVDSDAFWWHILKELKEQWQLRKLPPVNVPLNLPKNATRIPPGHYYAATVMRHFLDSVNVSYVAAVPPK